jgi:hypothetical protein
MVNNLKEAPLVCKVPMLVTSPQQPNQEVHHFSTSLNPLRTSVATQLVESTKKVELLEVLASAEGRATTSNDPTAAQTKLPSTKVISFLSGTKQRKTKTTAVIILISRTVLAGTMNLSKNKRCRLLRTPSPITMPHQ